MRNSAKGGAHDAVRVKVVHEYMAEDPFAPGLPPAGEQAKLIDDNSANLIDAGHPPGASGCIDEAARNTNRQALKVLMSSITEGVWFLTRGAQALERDYGQKVAANLSGSLLWGFGKAVAREAGYLQARMIDLDPDPGQGQSAEDLVNELMFPDREDHIAWRPAGGPFGEDRRKPAPHHLARGQKLAVGPNCGTEH